MSKRLGGIMGCKDKTSLLKLGLRCTRLRVPGFVVLIDMTDTSHMNRTVHVKSFALSASELSSPQKHSTAP